MLRREEKRDPSVAARIHERTQAPAANYEIGKWYDQSTERLRNVTLVWRLPIVPSPIETSVE